MDETLPTAIAGRVEFAAALRAVLADAADRGTRELWLVDPDFAPWPLGERDTVALLLRWAQGGPGRHVTFMAHRFDDVPRRHPRFAAWRRDWAHVITCREVGDIDASEVPTLLLAGDGLGLQLLERQHVRGRWFRDESAWRTWREVIDALLQRSVEAFPATTLGL
jgi:hypothetical protein